MLSLVASCAESPADICSLIEQWLQAVLTQLHRRTGIQLAKVSLQFMTATALVERRTLLCIAQHIDSSMQMHVLQLRWAVRK
jgi:hypothetical protein